MSLISFQTVSEYMPPKPTLTEEHLPDLTGRVYIITGSTSGVGLELARILYSKNARVYLCGRSEATYKAAVANITSKPSSGTTGPYKGELLFLQFDLTNLNTIKPAVQQFLRTETLLHSVWYNAAVMVPPKGSLTAQGYELQWGTNVVAHFLLHTLLTPILIASAKQLPPNSVRTVWVSSSVNMAAPSPGGIDWNSISTVDQPAASNKIGAWKLYGQSKAGAIICAHETAQRLGKQHGVVAVSLNPGNLKTPLQRHVPGWQMCLMNRILFEPRMGALTELFAGFAKEISVEQNNGAYVIPWGRLGEPRRDIKEGYVKGETGKKLWDILEKEVQSYLH
ncbi:MAG: hypothetical protein M1816_001030 [Peltula sp. TS41687]|nr:MAG: hypothetical protein M1816_001030 [Peltula sp. TS41687]